MLESVLKNIPSQKLAVHFHDTWGQANLPIFIRHSVCMGY
ncbi:hypothetical protein P4S64_03280 [Vibrio sp. M60_M31a]